MDFSFKHSKKDMCISFYTDYPMVEDSIMLFMNNTNENIANFVLDLLKGHLKQDNKKDFKGLRVGESMSQYSELSNSQFPLLALLRLVFDIFMEVI